MGPMIRSMSPRIMADSDDDRSSETEGAPEILWRRPEVALAWVAGTLVAVHLAPIQTPWLPDLRAAITRAADLNGGPVPLLSVFRLDARFPLRPGFDSNLGELRDTLRLLETSILGCAAVLEFGGILRAVMATALRTISLVSGRKPPIGVHDSVVSGVRWLATLAPANEASTRELLLAVSDLERALGCDVSSSGRTLRAG